MYIAGEQMQPLIYTDAQHNDVGVITDYKLDIAFGSDENSFELKVQRNSVFIEMGGYIYINETEYGGIVDALEIRTEEDCFVYSGRTWHGILAHNIICPYDNEDFFVVNAEDANIAIAQVLARANICDYTMLEEEEETENPFDKLVYLDGVFQPLFTKADAQALTPITNYEVRYESAWDVIKNMLYSVGLKPQFRYPAICEKEGQEESIVKNACQIYAVPLQDYSQNDEWNAKNKRYNAKKTYNRINHIICLGQGELKNRYKIHLYADANGNILPWHKDKINYYDGDYEQTSWCCYDETTTPVTMVFGLLYNRKSKCYYIERQNGELKNVGSDTDNFFNFGWDFKPDTIEAELGEIKFDAEYILDERSRTNDIAEVLDYPTAPVVDNYIAMKLKPVDFDTNYFDYFVQENNNGTISYKNVEAIFDYKLTTAQPSDWATNYANYYKNNGNNSYSSASGIEQEVAQAVGANQPSDWAYNYQSYRYMFNDGQTTEYKKIKGVDVYDYAPQKTKPSDWATNYSSYFVNGTAYYTNTSKTWKQNKYYEWNGEKYVLVKKKPEGWAKNYKTYCTKKTNQKIAVPATKAGKTPKWKSGKYYTKYVKRVDAPAYKEINTQYGVYRITSTITVAPTWQSNMYFTKSQIAPKWQSLKYYFNSVDHYKELVRAGLEKLIEYQNADTIEADLSQEFEYDINDLVCVVDDEANFATFPQPITKKIVKIEKHTYSIRYEIGGN